MTTLGPDQCCGTLLCRPNKVGLKEYRHQDFQFSLWYAARFGTESEHQVLNGSHIFISFTRMWLLFGTKFQYLHKRIEDEWGKQYDKPGIRDLVLTFCPTMRLQQRKLRLLMPVFAPFYHKSRQNTLRTSSGAPC